MGAAKNRSLEEHLSAFMHAFVEEDMSFSKPAFMPQHPSSKEDLGVG
jgi:hypothetical protein